MESSNHRQIILSGQHLPLAVWSGWFCLTLVWYHTLCQSTAQPGAYPPHLYYNCCLPRKNYIWVFSCHSKSCQSTSPPDLLHTAKINVPSCDSFNYSLDLSLMVPIFHEAILNVLYGISHDVDLTGPFPVLSLTTTSTQFPVPFFPRKLLRICRVFKLK